MCMCMQMYLHERPFNTLECTGDQQDEHRKLDRNKFHDERILGNGYARTLWVVQRSLCYIWNKTNQQYGQIPGLHRITSVFAITISYTEVHEGSCEHKCVTRSANDALTDRKHLFDKLILFRSV